VAACTALGGYLAPYKLGPAELKAFAASEAEAWVMDYCENTEEPILDQSSFGKSDNPAHDTVNPSGACAAQRHAWNVVTMPLGCGPPDPRFES